MFVHSCRCSLYCFFFFFFCVWIWCVYFIFSLSGVCIAMRLYQCACVCVSEWVTDWKCINWSVYVYMAVLFSLPFAANSFSQCTYCTFLQLFVKIVGHIFPYLLTGKFISCSRSLYLTCSHRLSLPLSHLVSRARIMPRRTLVCPTFLFFISWCDDWIATIIIQKMFIVKHK